MFPWDYLNVPKYVLQIVAEIRISYTEKWWDTVCLLPSLTMLQCWPQLKSSWESWHQIEAVMLKEKTFFLTILELPDACCSHFCRNLEKRFLSSRAPEWNQGSTRNNGSIWWSCLQTRVYKQLLPRMLLTWSGKQKVKSLCYCKTQSYGWQERFGIQQGAPDQQCLVSVPIESLLTQVSFKSSQI